MSNRLICTSLASLVLVTPPIRAVAQGSRPRILVEPNVQVSKDPTVQHAELYIAAHPTDAKKLVGIATTLRDVGSRVMLELYSSTDGGYSWTANLPPDQIRRGGGDPIVGFGSTGTAFGVALGGAMWVYRAEDGGATWSDAIKAGGGDHERMAIDWGTGRFAGRAYLAAEVIEDRSSHPDSMNRAAHLWRSQDDGRSWIGPTVVARGSTNGISVNGLVTLSDGTVGIFYNTYVNPAKDKTTSKWDVFLALSTDGGVSFAPPRLITQHMYGGYGDVRYRQAQGRIDDPWGSDFAVDTRGPKYRDRMYTVYAESRKPGEGGRLVIRYSSDRGVTWSAPKDLVPETRSDVSQFQPAIAVSKGGTVGVMWYDTRDVPARDGWHLYFSASADGGESFSLPVRVTSMPSRPFNAGNSRPVVAAAHGSEHGISVVALSSFDRWPNGGDYMGLAADADGVFHAFWSDARRGAFQAYTSRLRVLTSDADVAKLASPGKVERRAVNGSIGLEFDPTEIDWATGEIDYLVRLKNVSSDTLYGPFTAEVTTVAPYMGTGDTSAVETIVNASNGVKGKGATFEYGAVELRDIPWLAPGAVTEAKAWRVKPKYIRHTGLSFQVSVTGGVVAR